MVIIRMKLVNVCKAFITVLTYRKTAIFIILKYRAT